MKKSLLAAFSLLTALTAFAAGKLLTSEVKASAATAAENAAAYRLNTEGAVTDRLVFSDAIGDNMIYQQNEPVCVWGFAPANTSVSVTLEKQNGGDAATKNATAGLDGYYECTFEGKPASYDEYKITATDGVTTVDAEHVLFGEVFISCGQSNMALNVQYCSNANELLENANNPYLRIFMSPEVAGSANLPYYPTAYYPGGVWVRGDSAIMVQGASAVTYNFAVSLFQSLNVDGAKVPVGFLNASKGATSIEAWLSRPSIETDADVKAYLSSKNRLLDEKDYNKAGSNNFNQVSGLFNAKIAPLTNFYVKGILWYQGENNVGNEIAGQYYKNALSLLIQDWSRWFGDQKETLPLIFAQITPHNYGYEPEALAYMWEGMSEAYLENKDHAAMVTTYDVPLDWYNPNFSYRSPIHPIVKQPVGERMAKFAINMLYGGTGEKSSPVYKTSVFEGDSAKISFDNAASLKTTDGLDPVGFALCGENRIFYPATATMNTDGTVTLKSRWVKKPVAATYAFSAMSVSANLCSGDGFPVAAFRTDKVKSTYYHPKDWQYCDRLSYFVSEGSGTQEGIAEHRDAYQSSTFATLSVTEDGDSGNAVKMSYTLRGRETFWFSPVLNQSGVYEQFANYDTFSFKVKNSQKRAVSIDSVEVALSDGRTGALLLSDENATSAEIAGESGYQTFDFSLNTLVTSSGNVDISDSRALITDVKIYFKDYLSGELLLDGFEYGNRADRITESKVESGETPPPSEGNAGGAGSEPQQKEETKKQGCGSVTYVCCGLPVLFLAAAVLGKKKFK